MEKRVFDYETNEIDKNVDENITEIYNYKNGNSNSNLIRLKLFSVYINNRSSLFEQSKKPVKIIQSFFNDAKIDNVLSTTIRQKLDKT